MSGPHDLNVDPRFIAPSTNAATADFRLQSGSPALDSGTTQAGVTSTRDNAGIARPQGTGIDRGAYELPVAVTPPTPPPSVQSPFGGTARTLPGKLELSAYDLGGEGVAYHDEDATNSGGALRSDGVDLESSSEGGANVGWIGAGEWLEYTVNTRAGTYPIQVRVAAPTAGGSLRLMLDGTSLGTVVIPATGGWQQWQTVTVPSVTISGGNARILRVEMIAGGFNVSTIEFLDSGLPSGWTGTDIGAVGLIGSTTHSQGVWTLKGSGADIWNNADSFQFASRPVTGDVQITAQVTGLTNTDQWAKAGVMIRTALTPGSAHASTFVTPVQGACFQRRLSANAASVHTSGARVAAPYWVRCERVGSTIISSASANGTTWTEIRRETIALGSTVFVGLAVTSHQNGLLATATFANVQVIAAPSAAN